MKYFIVDAFTEKIFKGNPAGVCILEKELDAGVMQNIAAENNLAETAFVLQKDGYYDLRWFTPKNEIDLCGHATIGSAYVLANFYNASNKMRFETIKSGTLFVGKDDDVYTLDFPATMPNKISVTDAMEHAIGTPIVEAYVSFDGRDLIFLLENERQIINVTPNFHAIEKLANHAVAVTAKGDEADFVSRFFAPKMGVPEDPVTGSSHTRLIPFWAERLGKEEMTAKQLSERGGTLICKYLGDRVKISGTAVLYLKGEIFL